jgi:hypothetical protein
MQCRRVERPSASFGGDSEETGNEDETPTIPAVQVRDEMNDRRKLGPNSKNLIESVDGDAAYHAVRQHARQPPSPGDLVRVLLRCAHQLPGGCQVVACHAAAHEGRADAPRDPVAHRSSPVVDQMRARWYEAGE